MKPTLGRIVIYHDTTHSYPMIINQVHENGEIGGWIFGEIVFYRTSIREGDGPGEWQWPLKNG